MAALLEEPIIQPRLEPRDRLSRQVNVRPTPSRESQPRNLRDRINAAGKRVLGLVRTTIHSIGEGMLYLVSMITLPLLPFIVPLLLGPLILVYVLFMIGVAAAAGLT